MGVVMVSAILLLALAIFGALRLPRASCGAGGGSRKQSNPADDAAEKDDTQSDD